MSDNFTCAGRCCCDNNYVGTLLFSGHVLKLQFAVIKSDNAVIKSDNAVIKSDNAGIKSDNAVIKSDAVINMEPFSFQVGYLHCRQTSQVSAE